LYIYIEWNINIVLLYLNICFVFFALA